MIQNTNTITVDITKWRNCPIELAVISAIQAALKGLLMIANAVVKVAAHTAEIDEMITVC